MSWTYLLGIEWHEWNVVVFLWACAFCKCSLLNWYYYRIHLLALKTKCITLKAYIPSAIYFLCFSWIFQSTWWWSCGFHFFFNQKLFWSSPLPNLVDPRLSGAEWKWKLVINFSAFFTCVTSSVMEMTYLPPHCFFIFEGTQLCQV